MSSTAARTGYGSLLELSDGSASPLTIFTALAEVAKFTDVGAKRDSLDATHMLSPGQAKEFLMALKESKQFGIEVNYLPTDATQKDLLTNLSQQTPSACYRGWRIVFPDFGAVSTNVVSLDTATDIVTIGSTAPSWLTGQPVQFANVGGSLPAPLVAGTTYYTHVLSGTTFTLHTNPADAAAGTNAVDLTTTGSGTTTANGTSNFSFSAAVCDFNFNAEPSAVLRGQIKFSVSGTLTLSP
jgi:hypothetical protein